MIEIILWALTFLVLGYFIYENNKLHIHIKHLYEVRKNLTRQLEYCNRNTSEMQNELKELRAYRDGSDIQVDMEILGDHD